MLFGIKQQFARLRLQHIRKRLGLDSCCVYKNNFFLVVLVHRKLPHITFIPIHIISENLQ